jgi:hypothetical protein
MDVNHGPNSVSARLCTLPSERSLSRAVQLLAGETSLKVSNLFPLASTMKIIRDVDTLHLHRGSNVLFYLEVRIQLAW